jgi:pimeloyl-ACP methyl ester carboxylesterase
MEERIDLGPCRAIRHERDADRCAVLLPGLFYPTRAPALWFAREAAMAQGWSALEVLGEAGDHEDELGWERRCAESALEAARGARVLVIGKSLASLLAGEISERDLPAVWLTPLLNQPSVIDGLARTRRPVLLVGGDSDPTWQPASVAAGRPIEALELPGADHSLQVPGDLVASIGALGLLTEAIARFVERV